MKNSRLTIVLLYCLTLSLAGCLPEGCNGPDENPYTRIFNLMFDIPTFQRLSASLFIGARAR